MAKKLDRFADNEKSKNIIQVGKPLYDEIRGNWGKKFFNNRHDIVLELGCGDGLFTTEMARMFPQRNFIGVDIKGSRIWVGSQKAKTEELTNVAFLRTQAGHLDRFLGPGEVCEIWLTFPDPRPKRREEKKRLSHPRFLDLYNSILSDDGCIHLKTDDSGLYRYTEEVLEKRRDFKTVISTGNLYKMKYIPDYQNIKTKYEQKFLSLGKSIKYIKSTVRR